VSFRSPHIINKLRNTFDVMRGLDPRIHDEVPHHKQY